MKPVFRIEALVTVSNEFSSRALLKNSFRHEGRLRGHNRSSLSPTGLREDCHLYSRTFDLRSQSDRGYVQGNFVDRTSDASTPSSTRFRMDHVLEVDKATGEILRIEPSSSPWASALVEDEATTWLWRSSSRGDFVTPGFIDTHAHAPQYSFAGTATDRPLMGSEGWLETYTFPGEEQRDEKARVWDIDAKLSP